MSEETFKMLIDQAADMGYKGRINIQFFNEPLLDSRLEEFGKYAKDKGCFSSVQCYSNADLLTPERAATIDGNFDIMYIALYDKGGGIPLPIGEERSRKERDISSWFTKTVIKFTGGDHIITHYSPLPGLAAAIERARMNPCIFDVQERLIIDFTGEMRLCCDDIAGEWQLGNIFENTLEELWYSEKHQEIVENLRVRGGRKNYAFCWECPR